MRLGACLTCPSVSGEAPISPVPPVHVGRRWRVEQVGPGGRPGWMVLVAVDHREALHELDAEEWEELSALLPRVVAAVHEATGSQKEHVAAFYEKPGYRHVHWHVVPVFADDPPEARGTAVFSQLSTTAPAAELVAVSGRVRALLAGSGGT